MSQPSELGDLLRGIRQELNYSQLEFGRALGVSQGAISRFEHRPDAAPNATVLVNLSREFGHIPAIRSKLMSFLFKAPRKFS